MKRVLFKNIKELFQVERTTHSKAIAGEAMRQLPSISNAYLAIEDDSIVDFGKMEDLHGVADWNNLEVIDVEGKCILPTWVDSHTHLVFAKSREQEFVYRIEGLSYEEIGKRGGGIVNSALKLRAASFEQLYDDAYQRLNEIMHMGTGGVEIKSGYGLTVESELKMLRVVRKLKENHPLTIKGTLLAAHAIPPEFKDNREDWISVIENEILPIVAEEELAEHMDIFCERNYYTAEETDRLLEAASKYGLKPKVHVNQFSIAGGLEAAIKHQALSVDHLEEMDESQIEALLNSNTIPTVLPSCSYFLNIPYAPARQMINAGLPVAMATDYNPGSTPSGNIPFLLSLACTKLRLTPEEAINAVTLNGAHAMNIQATHGSIALGKAASFIITKEIPSLAYIPYAFGSNHIDQVYIHGKAQ